MQAVGGERTATCSWRWIAIPEQPRGDACLIARGFGSVLFNLLSNACKFTKKGEIRFEMVRQRRRRPGTGLTFRSDRYGDRHDIGKRAARRSFRAFVQAETRPGAEVRRHGPGTYLDQGLLRAARRPVIRPERGRGSTFLVRLPAEGTNPEWDSVAGQVGDAIVPAGGSP